MCPGHVYTLSTLHAHPTATCRLGTPKPWMAKWLPFNGQGRAQGSGNTHMWLSPASRGLPGFLKHLLYTGLEHQETFDPGRPMAFPCLTLQGSAWHHTHRVSGGGCVRGPSGDRGWEHGGRRIRGKDRLWPKAGISTLAFHLSPKAWAIVSKICIFPSFFSNCSPSGREPLRSIGKGLEGLVHNTNPSPRGRQKSEPVLTKGSHGQQAPGHPGPTTRVPGEPSPTHTPPAHVLARASLTWTCRLTGQQHTQYF